MLSVSEAHTYCSLLSSCTLGVIVFIAGHLKKELGAISNITLFFLRILLGIKQLETV